MERKEKNEFVIINFDDFTRKKVGRSQIHLSEL